MKGKKLLVPPGQSVEFEEERPLPPDFLTKDALDCWDYMAARLERAHILVGISRDKLARYCQAWADYSEIMMARKKMGGAKRIAVTENNWRQQLHWTRMIDQCEGIMRDFEREYGLTPASSSRVRRNTKGHSGATPLDELQDFLDAETTPAQAE